MRTTADAEAEERRLREDVLAWLEARPGQWVPFGEMLPMAPLARLTGYAEIEERPFGFDDPRGPAYDAGPAGERNGPMLADVLRALKERELLAEEGFAQPGGPGTPGFSQWRLLNLGEPAGLKEIAAWLGVREATAHTWHARGVLPDPTWPSVGGRPAWRRSVIRDWAIATGRHAGGANGPRWNGVNGEGSGTVVDSATGSPIEQ